MSVMNTEPTTILSELFNYEFVKNNSPSRCTAQGREQSHSQQDHTASEGPAHQGFTRKRIVLQEAW